MKKKEEEKKKKEEEKKKKKKEEEEERRRRAYFPIPNYSGVSIVDALETIGADSRYGYRCTIAAKNGIGGYTGTPKQNTYMLNLLKNGNLLRP